MFQREEAIGARAARFGDAQVFLQFVVERIRPIQRAGQIGADLQPVLPLRPLAEHRVETGDGLHLRRVHIAERGHFPQRFRREVTIGFLREEKQRHHRRTLIGIFLEGSRDAIGVTFRQRGKGIRHALCHALRIHHTLPITIAQHNIDAADDRHHIGDQMLARQQR